MANKVGNGYRVQKALNQIALKFNSKSTQNWRSYFAIQAELRKNPVILAAFYGKANSDFAKIHELFRDAHQYVLKQVQQNQIPLDPSHPAVVNNPYHPLNPTNANTLQRNLMINPALNPLFLEDLNSQASVETEENNLQSITQLLQNTLNSELVLNAAAAALTRNPELDPHKALGLQSDAKETEIQTMSLRRLSEEAPNPSLDQKTLSNRFEDVAAATVILNSSLIVPSHLKKDLEDLLKKSHHFSSEDHPSLTPST